MLQPVVIASPNVQVSVEAVNNARIDYAKNFDALALKADAQKKHAAAQEFRMYAAMLRNEFVGVGLTVPKHDDGMDCAPTDTGGKARFTLYDANYLATMDAYGKYYPSFGTEGLPLLMLDEYVGQETLGTAAVAHELSHYHELALASGETATESQLEWLARQSASRALDVATNGAYTKAIAAAVKGIRTPTSGNGFVVVALDRTVFELFPDEHGDRRMNWLFDQAEIDANAVLDAKSAKGTALTERRDTLYARWYSMPGDQRVEYLQASDVADE